MQLEGARVSIGDGSIYTGSVGTVVSHADGVVAVTIETGVGRGRTISLMDLLVREVLTFDGKSIKPEADRCASY